MRKFSFDKKKWRGGKTEKLLSLMNYSATGVSNVLSFYPPKSNSKSILIFRILDYNSDSNLTNCISPDLKLHNQYCHNCTLSSNNVLESSLMF